MNFSDQSQAILDHIAEQAGIEPFQFDDTGRAFFNANDMTFLFYGLEDEKVLVTAIYMGQPDLDDADFLYTVLCGNHLWELTGGGSLSIDSDTGHICLHHRLDLPLEDPAEIEAFFGNLLGAADYWKEILSKADGATGSNLTAAEAQHFIRV
ncbi:MAG: type III secretion system chaperone [Desulfobacterium sp.]|nr:type III secretion system chaperone [Desulfobacterium sp.]